MKLDINEKILSKWPEIKIGVLVLKGINNQKGDTKILAELRKLESQKKLELSEVDFNTIPEIAVWKKIYHDFFSNPRDYRPSVEALLRRVRGGSLILSINNLVNLTNYLALKYQIPVRAEDLKKIEGDMELTFAEGNEAGKYIDYDEEDTCYRGEVIYKDACGFTSRRWNWRSADRTKVENETTDAFMIFETMQTTALEKLQQILEETKSLVRQNLGGKISEYILDINNPHIEIT